MTLYEEIFAEILKKEEMQIICPNIKIDPREIVDLVCYRTLQKIKTVIEDDSLADDECFMKIEEIVTLFEQLGSHGGNRHDFG